MLQGDKKKKNKMKKKKEEEKKYDDGDDGYDLLVPIYYQCLVFALIMVLLYISIM